MPFTCCCVPGCSNRGGHLFPKDGELKKKWLNAIKRNSFEEKHKEWTPSKSSVVCYDHFMQSDYTSITSFGTNVSRKQLKKGSVPTVFCWKRKLSSSTPDRSDRLFKRNKTKSELSFTEENVEINDPCTSDIGREECVESTTAPILHDAESDILYTAVPLNKEFSCQYSIYMSVPFQCQMLQPMFI